MRRAPVPIRRVASVCKTPGVDPLQLIPNVGPAIAADLRRLGVDDPSDLVGQDPGALYDRLCTADGLRHDPCVLDVFSAAIAYVNGEPARPWWEFSRERKARAVQAP